MAFIETRFPDKISFGSKGGPGFSTSIVEGESGSSERVSRWPNARRRYNARFGIKTVDDLNSVLDLYIICSGPSKGLRYKDWLDFTTSSNHRSAPGASDVELLKLDGTPNGDGTATVFQLRTKYIVGSNTVYRTITKPVSATILAALNGTPTTAFTTDTTTGRITFTSAPGAGVVVTAGCEFDVPVQFGAEIDEVLAASIDNFESGDIPDIPLVEMVGDTASPDRFYYGGGTNIGTQASGLATVDFSKGRTIVYTGAGAVTFLMPDPTDLELGGPYFFIYNGGTATPTITLKTFDNVTQIGTGTIGLGKSAIMIVWDDSGTKKWLSLTN